MKSIVLALIKRNVIVGGVFALTVTGLRLAPDTYSVPGLLIPILLIGGLIWANRPLIQKGHPIAALLLSFLLVPIFGIPVGMVSFLIDRRFAELRYEAQGIQLVDGCNGAAANSAEFDLYAITERLTELTNSPVVNIDQIAQLQNVRVIAQEKAQILNDDCGRRGHRENHPWKTNWVAIKQALAETEQSW